MKEYIEKSSLLETMSRNSITEKITFADGKSIIETVREFPAADVVERKRGEWIEVSYWKYQNGRSIRYTAKRCSVCGADVGKKTQYNGCPYCFADMRGDGK